MDENMDLMGLLREDKEQNEEEQEQSDGFSEVGDDDIEDDPTDIIASSVGGNIPLNVSQFQLGNKLNL